MHLDKTSLKLKYDSRYQSDYMDSDTFSVWTQQGLAAFRVRQTLEQIDSKPETILDYGTGQGKWIPLLQEMYPDAKITGIDISEVAIDKAKNKYPSCNFYSFDGEKSPFDDNTFDLIFSFHVLEHVLDIESTLDDIARILKPQGYACIIFPCGNRKSFEEKIVSSLEGGIIKSDTGESIFFHEKNDGHLRRMRSGETIKLFEERGIKIFSEAYSGQFFSSIDWIVRGTGPWYINRLLKTLTPTGPVSKVRLSVIHIFLFYLNRFINLKNLDIKKPRNPVKQSIVILLKKSALFTDQAIVNLALWEWRHHRHKKNGTVQYLIFKKIT